MTKESIVIITGASSGIGRALAIQYSTEKLNLCLIGRSEESLKKVRDKCIDYGAKNVDMIVADVRNADLMKSIINNIAEKYIIDIVFCSAAISSSTADKESDIQEQIIDTNINGTFNIVNPVIPIMKAQKSGHIAVFGSLAQFVSLPDSGDYIMTKSAVASYGECLNIELEKYNIKVSIILPGFVNSKMSKASNYKDLSMLPSEKAAHIIKDGIDKGKTYIIFPKLTFIMLKLFSILPFILRKYIIKNFVKN